MKAFPIFPLALRLANIDKLTRWRRGVRVLLLGSFSFSGLKATGMPRRLSHAGCPFSALFDYRSNDKGEPRGVPTPFLLGCGGVLIIRTVIDFGLDFCHS